MSTDHRESLAKVLNALPCPSENLSIPDRARSMLTLVLTPALQPGSYEPPFPIDPTRCPSCDRAVDSVKSPYCGDRCREVAGFVRQTRSGIRDESLFNPDRQIALGQILWQILGGGLPLRNSLIDAKVMARLMAKHEGCCAECGESATTVDHIGSFCNRTSNLRPMCATCAQTKPFGSPGLLASPGVQALRAELSRRIGNLSPIRSCDDATTWNWRGYVEERKAILSRNAQPHRNEK